MAVSFYRCADGCYSLAGPRRVGAEHGDGFNLDQQLGPTEDGLDTGGRRQRIEPLLLKECSSFLVESVVVAIDVAQVARWSAQCRARYSLRWQAAR